MIRDLLSALGLYRRESDSLQRPIPEAAAGLRPAEAGVALAGGARPSHLAATLIDLNIRGHVRIEQCGSEDDPDFLLARGTAPVGQGPGGPGRDSLARYETTLLRGLPRGPEQQPLSQLKTTKKWVKAITGVYHQLNREAVLRGWVRPAVPEDTGPGDDSGERALRQLRAFRQRLRQMAASGSGAQASLGDYLPYAIAFGLMPEWSGRFPESPLPEATGPLPYPGGGLNQYALAVAFTGAACDHVQSIASQAGYAGVGDHHAGGYSHGHGGGFGGGQMGGGGHHG
jgi:hypothetical protein